MIFFSNSSLDILFYPNIILKRSKIEINFNKILPKREPRLKLLVGLQKGPVKYIQSCLSNVIPSDLTSVIKRRYICIFKWNVSKSFFSAFYIFLLLCLWFNHKNKCSYILYHNFFRPRFSRTLILVKPGVWKYRPRFDKQ